jgi:excinuclease UvrABC nuclease subunit
MRMATGQLWLFPPPRPLVERLGEEFFRQLPPRPGVYLMCAADAGVLYVGRAKNLRHRLGSYRVANPERLPRRTIRLLYRVTRIEIDECANEAAAREREEALICVLAPRFNRAGKVWPLR